MDHLPAISRPALLAALLLPALAAAQPETDGRIETLLEEDRGDAPLPEIAWEESFQGLYAVEGACDDPDAVWAFALDALEMGRTICTSLGKMTWDGDWLVVPGGECSRMGESVESQWIALRDEGDGAISARTEDSDVPVRLEACSPHGE